MAEAKVPSPVAASPGGGGGGAGAGAGVGVGAKGGGHEDVWERLHSESASFGSSKLAGAMAWGVLAEATQLEGTSVFVLLYQ